MTRSNNALRKILKDLGMEGALELGRIASNWGVLFSGPLALHTSPESLSKGVLTVNVNSPSWLHQAGFYKGSMLGKLRKYGVSSIRFRRGPVRAYEHSSPTAQEASLETPEAMAEAESLTAHVEDEELRESIRRAAVRSLSIRPRRRGAERNE